jgi:hypothetical protein
MLLTSRVRSEILYERPQGALPDCQRGYRLKCNAITNNRWLSPYLRAFVRGGVFPIFLVFVFFFTTAFGFKIFGLPL